MRSSLKNTNVSLRLVTLLLLALSTCPTVLGSDQVVFSIVDRLQFSVPGNWPVISSKSDAAQTVFAFQIPNAADEGTPDSSNLVIVSSYLKNAHDRDAFKEKASNPNHDAKEKKLIEGWRCSSFSAMQKPTQYVIWDCYRVIVDSGVHVRIAWPHLPKNPQDFDKQMESVLSDFLKSVGPYKQPSK